MYVLYMYMYVCMYEFLLVHNMYVYVYVQLCMYVCMNL